MNNTQFEAILVELRAIRAVLERPTRNADAPPATSVDARRATTLGELADSGITLGELADSGITLGELAESGPRRPRG